KAGGAAAQGGNPAREGGKLAADELGGQRFLGGELFARGPAQGGAQLIEVGAEAELGGTLAGEFIGGMHQFPRVLEQQEGLAVAAAAGLALQRGAAPAVAQ